MDLTVTAAHAIDKAAAARAEALEAIAPAAAAGEGDNIASAGAARGPEATSLLVRGGFVERVLGETHAAVSAPPAQPPETRVDKGVETAAVQTQARAHPPAAEQAHRADAALPAVQPAQSDFALPAEQLVPAALVGLRVVHAESWPLPNHPFGPDPRPPLEARAARKEAQARAPRQEPAPERDADESASEAPRREEPSQHDAACGAVFGAADGGAWCEALTRVLRVALSARIPPHALLVAAGQWQRGRCVVLACPQGSDPAGAAWAFVLWPRKPAPRRAATPAPLELFGLRVEARLQWSVLPQGLKWRQVRVIKEHHPRSGRQLITAAPAEVSGRVACEVQLGPVLARPMHCCDVCVRISAAQRFWSALGAQWSMFVVVCSYPLLEDDLSEEKTPC